MTVTLFKNSNPFGFFAGLFILFGLTACTMDEDSISNCIYYAMERESLNYYGIYQNLGSNIIDKKITKKGTYAWEFYWDNKIYSQKYPQIYGVARNYGEFKIPFTVGLGFKCTNDIQIKTHGNNLTLARQIDDKVENIEMENAAKQPIFDNKALKDLKNIIKDFENQLENHSQ